MPIYSYKCAATGEQFDRFERMKETGKSTVCACGSDASKVYHSPMAFVESDCPPHKAPITGEIISSNKQRAEFMRRNGLIDGNDFSPSYLARENKERRERLNREAEKAYDYLPNGLKPETVLKEALHD